MDGPQADVCHCLCSALCVITEIDVHVCRHLLSAQQHTATTPTNNYTHTDTQHKLNKDGRGILGSFIAWKFCWACGSLNVCAPEYIFAPR